jgi:Leucine-rich repeat (LRR) protein
MGPRIQLYLLVFCIQISDIAAQSRDYVVLLSLKDAWKNTPPNWIGTNPCGDSWEGIACNNSRVISITLSSMRLVGQLTGDIQGLSELQTLDLSYNPDLGGSIPASIGNLRRLSNLILVGCSFSGTIPDSIGSLEQLVFLSLNSNRLTGPIPPTLGNLRHLYWLDLADNQLTGTIPVSSVTRPGLDMLINTKHFHFGGNQISGQIPSRLFSSSMVLLHLLLENNQLTGNIPPTLGLVQTLEVVRLDRNSLSGPVPPNINDLTNVNDLFLSNNRLTGLLPNLTGMNFLHYVDMSNNTFNVSDVPSWFSSLQSLTTLLLERTNLRGSVPAALFQASQLQTVVLRNNQLNGTLDIGSDYSSQLQQVDLQNNLISGFIQRAGFNISLVLAGNPICEESGGIDGRYCTVTRQAFDSYSTPSNNCVPTACGSSNQIASPNCQCAYPFTGRLNFRAPSFSSLGNATIYISLEESLMESFRSRQLPVDSVSLRNPNKNLDDYLVITLEVFPAGQDYFNRTGASRIGFVLSNQTFKPPSNFGPFVFIGEGYQHFSDVAPGEGRSSSNTGMIIGIAVGGSALVSLLLIAGFYAYHLKKKAKKADQRNNPFAALWDPTVNSGGVPQLQGARSFSFEELKRYTSNFSETNSIGSGGYGKVYRGSLPNKKLIAIKRAVQGSTQGGFEFKTEIELLSRVHHKNVVSLVGFCFEQAEQMIVYEYIPNGALKESLAGKSGIRLDWPRRLRIAIGAARGLQYLHDLANPPIIHRDVKSNNILLDERLNAKVADFGLSKPMGDTEKGHVSTQVKGTMGYLDPEYYMTQQLTEKSDVYSFGVVLLEILTARTPIQQGKYIVREVKQLMDVTKDLYNLQGILDPTIGQFGELKGLEKFVDISMRCVEEAGAHRPAMSEVVKEIESVMKMAGLNPNIESASTSASHEGAVSNDHPYSTESLFAYSGAYLPSKLDPK